MSYESVSAQADDFNPFIRAVDLVETLQNLGVLKKTLSRKEEILFHSIFSRALDCVFMQGLEAASADSSCTDSVDDWIEDQLEKGRNGPVWPFNRKLV